MSESLEDNYYERVWFGFSGSGFTARVLYCTVYCCSVLEKGSGSAVHQELEEPAIGASAGLHHSACTVMEQEPPGAPPKTPYTGIMGFANAKRQFSSVALRYSDSHTQYLKMFCRQPNFNESFSAR